MLRPTSRATRASTHGVAGALTALFPLLALTGCGSSSDENGGDDGPTPPATAQAAPKDKGPLCVGKAGADGVHVLRGGGFRLPGGGGVQYAGATADGTSRTATLRDGEKYEEGQKEQTVEPGQKLTVSGHVYTVRQICSYRVVLEPQDAQAKAALTAAPASLEAKGGEADAGLCFSTAPSVLAAASEGFPAKGDTLQLVNNGGVSTFPTGLSLTASVDATAQTARIGANCAAIPVAIYEDVRAGDTVEFGHVLFKVTELTDDAVRLTRTSG